MISTKKSFQKCPLILLSKSSSMVSLEPILSSTQAKQELSERRLIWDQ